MLLIIVFGFSIVCAKGRIPNDKKLSVKVMIYPVRTLFASSECYLSVDSFNFDDSKGTRPTTSGI
jgi:hypothetical protein